MIAPPTLPSDHTADRPAAVRTLVLPQGFAWGAGTSAYQIEGAAAVDGKGPSIWDTFCAGPGHVVGGETGEQACDHFHRYPQDLDLAAALGLDTYRFSLSWSRIRPTGSGQVESRGLAFYDRLVDAVLARGLRPMVTLYHWDLPQALEDAGGWPSRDTSYRFAEFAATAVQHLGDRVDAWSTLNEPFCSAFLGYAGGVHAPGRKEPAQALAAMHHLLLGHGLAVEALRANGRPSHELSIVLNFSQVLPASDSPADLDAARRVDGLHHRVFLDPVLGDGYPADVREDTAHLTDWSFVREGDEQRIAAPIDWLGVNYYTSTRVAAAVDLSAPTPGVFPGLRGVDLLPPRGPLTSIGWEQSRDGLRDLLLRISREHPTVPLVVTENGSAWHDVRSADGSVLDDGRVAYLVAHLAAVEEAVASGADVRGYIAWSLLDNFEWAAGYAERFGLVHVDFATQERTIKESGKVYAEVVRRQREAAC